MKALIVGLGSIGHRHLSNLRYLEPATEIVVCHHSEQEGKSLDAGYWATSSLDEALDRKPDIAFVTGPTSVHVKTAMTIAERGVHLFIEKPLSNSLSGLEELFAMTQAASIKLMVGYNFRFHYPLQAMRQTLLSGKIGRPVRIHAEVGQYLPDWRPSIDYRQSVSSQEVLGGGAVLELSHEIDYVRWLMGEINTVSAKLDKVSDLEIDVEDTADLAVTFTSGASGTIHMDMWQQPARRTCQIDGMSGSLRWDGIHDTLSRSSIGADTWSEVKTKSPVERNDMYLAELRHFIDCVEAGKEPDVTGQDARRVLEIALAAKESDRNNGGTVTV